MGASEGDEPLEAEAEFVLEVDGADCPNWYSGDDGRRRCRGKAWGMDNGELSTGSASVVEALGVSSNSWFSDMVSQMSEYPPKLGYVSSIGRLSGLTRRPGGPSGLAGRPVMGDMSTLLVVSIIGEECALVIGGADRGLVEDRERR